MYSMSLVAVECSTSIRTTLACFSVIIELSTQNYVTVENFRSIPISNVILRTCHLTIIRSDWLYSTRLNLLRSKNKSDTDASYGSLSEKKKPTGYQQIKYGALYSDWRDMLRKGFAECLRVLESNGVLIFKWNETDIPVREILQLTPQKPLFGNRSGKLSKTHWICFIKD